LTLSFISLVIVTLLVCCRSKRANVHKRGTTDKRVSAEQRQSFHKRVNFNKHAASGNGKNKPNTLENKGTKKFAGGKQSA
jgi:hypothetical protein